MSKRANPVLIGAFVLGALSLLVGLIIYLGTVNLFSKEEQFVVYFESSVNGLNVGAPVKFKGVPIGRVNDIRIRWNQDPLSSHIPVFITIDPKTVSDRLGVELDIGDEDVLRQQIRLGLRARMQIESLISGLLFIELDYYPDNPGNFHQNEYVLKEIPSVPGLLSDITETATQIVARLRRIDFEGTNNRLQRVLERVDQSLQELDTKSLSQSIQETSAVVRGVAQSGQIENTLSDLATLLSQLSALVDKADRRVDPLAEEMVAMLADLRQTFQSLRQTARNLDGALSPQSPILLEVRRTLVETSGAARALRELADYLERNPNSLLLGRDQPDFVQP